MKSRKTLFGALAISYAVIIALESPAMGKPLFVKQAKELGFPAENCMYCHTVKLPKKEEAHKQFNDRGKWLFSEKERKGAKDVDLNWLKDYPGGPKQK